MLEFCSEAMLCYWPTPTFALQQMTRLLISLLPCRRVLQSHHTLGLGISGLCLVPTPSSSSPFLLSSEAASQESATLHFTSSASSFLFSSWISSSLLLISLPIPHHPRCSSFSSSSSSQLLLILLIPSAPHPLHPLVNLLSLLVLHLLCSPITCYSSLSSPPSASSSII